jgi:uncharacterized membrane protein YesL
MSKVADFMILNVLVLVFSIPVITIGPAVTAMYYVALKEVRGEEGYVVRDFWKAFRRNFRQGVIIELIVIVIALVLGLDIMASFRWSLEGSMAGTVFMYLNIGLAIVAAGSLMYLFPLLAQFENTIRKTMFNSLLMAEKNLPQTIIMLIVTGMIVYAIASFPLFIIVLIGLYAYVQSYVMVRTFKPYMPKEEEHTDEFEVPGEDDDVWKGGER